MKRSELARMFAAGKNGRIHNAHCTGTTYTLHSTVICERTPLGFRFNWGGWYTPTTAAHMNDILRALGSSMRVSYAAARDGEGAPEFMIPLAE